MKSSLAIALCALLFSASASAEPDYTVIARCSNDDLTREQASERLAWVSKCIDEKGGSFAGLTQEVLAHLEFETLEGTSPSYRSRPLYPSFVDENGFKLWPAPTDFTASCEIPETVAAAGFCLSH